MGKKFIFNDENDSCKVIENYTPTEEELNAIKEQEEKEKKEEEEERLSLGPDVSEMSIDEIKAWFNAEAKGMSFKEFKKKLDDKKKKAIKHTIKEKKSEHDTNLKINKILEKPVANSDRDIRMGRQKASFSARGQASVKRCYVIELENIQRLEEIKVYYYKNKYIQYSEIINDAIEHYYNYILNKDMC